MRILAFDLAREVTIVDGDVCAERVTSGAFSMGPGFTSHGLRARLEQLVGTDPRPDVVVYVLPDSVPGFGGFSLRDAAAIVDGWAMAHGIPSAGVPEAELREFAVGDRAALESQLLAAGRRWLPIVSGTEGEVRALWLAAWAAFEFAPGRRAL